MDQMAFVYAAYAIAVIGTLALVAQSWWDMRAAERRRDRARGR
ncbi:heme exporter protein CcmD [Aurantiacibacter spongiae]|uniref:Heme exporter protein CcmD n=1 Tax=Aurantiacibacter spongiae TaxID=2488860 RepID=A0A3N5D1E7_9SPHN|nr:heme exporter protein CcmD [Aurantiacibacter spongiae]